MKRDRQLTDEYIAAHIHKHFYFNEGLSTPTVIKEYQNIEKILVEARYIACVTIQFPQLNKIEYGYGSLVYGKLLADVTEMLKRLKEKEFRRDDILVVDLFDVDTFVIFLSPPRSTETQLLEHLEDIAERICTMVEQDVFDTFYPYTKDYAPPAVGFSLVINNPMINNLRLVMQLVSSAKKMGEFVASKHSYRSKYNLQKIIISEDVTTVFQPIVDMKTLEISGYEALSRGPANTEFHSPLLMFILALEHGLSFELDALCRRKAFESIRHLNTDKKIFVNTLAMTIHDPEFRGKYLEDLMRDLKIKPENVIFEINEKLAIDNYDLFRTALKDYSDIGIVHANDDVGAGYSDLERIMELNPGYMKIDISLVRGIHESYIKQQIVKALVSLAAGLGSQVIAEGVEHREEYEVLKSLNVHYGQGYLFGRPSACLQPGRGSGA